MKLHVISTSFNSNIFAINNILSVHKQKMQPSTHYYIDDVSTDNSVHILNEFKKTGEYKKVVNDYNIKIVINEKRNYKIKNLFNLIKDKEIYDDDDIICILDGDDWLSNENALLEIYENYKSKDLDYLYTNWMYSHNGEIGISQKIPDNNWDPYKDKWITSAMSTFRVRSFREINEENFKNEFGEWFTMACDQAYVLPILSLSRERNGNYSKIGFVDKPHYIYQFLQNKNKPRNNQSGMKMAKDAHDASQVIRKRGLIK